MRIGLLIYGSLETLTGGYFYDKQIVDVWRSLGDTVEIVSLPWRGYWRHLSDNWSKALLARLQRLPVDVLIQDQLCHPSVVWLNRRLQGRLPYPQLSLIHLLKQTEAHPAGLATIYRWLENDYLQHVDGFIYNSEDSRQLVEAQLKRPRPGVVAFPGRDHLPKSPRQPTADETLRIVSVGNIVKRKGQHLLIDALGRLKALPWTLTLVGSGEFEPDYFVSVQDLITRHRLTERVEVTGRLSNDKVGPLLASHDLFVLPSSYEGFGIVYLEALMAGLPVVATSAGAAHEVIEDGKSGMLIPPNDVNALAACLRALITDRERLVEMSAAAECRAEQFPTWHETAMTIRDFARSCFEASRD